MNGNSQFFKQAVEKAIQDLPAIPRVAQSIIAQTSDPDTSIQDIEKLIKSDQAITSKLLRVVNSAYYGLPGKVSNISQACLMLGTQQIRALVLSLTLFSSLNLETNQQKISMQKFWLHSLTSVSCVNIIGQKRKMSSVDLGFLQVCTLLHDMGRLLLFTSFPQLYDQSILKITKTKESIAKTEMEMWGLTHAEIGCRMAEVWKLPARICAVIGQHEGIFREETDWEAFPIHIADSICQFIYIDQTQPYIVQLENQALLWLNYQEEEIKSLRETCQQKLIEFCEGDGLEAA